MDDLDAKPLTRKQLRELCKEGVDLFDLLQKAQTMSIDDGDIEMPIESEHIYAILDKAYPDKEIYGMNNMMTAALGVIAATVEGKSEKN